MRQCAAAHPAGFRSPSAAAGVRHLVRARRLVPALFQRFYVKPNELQLEPPYIKRNIALTREAYDLSNIVVKPFPADQALNSQSLQDNRATIDNIRLWDRQPLIDTYAQLQEIRTYYKFLDADIDRYHARRRVSAGDAVGARAGARAASAQRADLGQPPPAVHPRQRRRDVAGHPEIHRRPADLLSAGHSAGRHRRSGGQRAAHLFRRGRSAPM